MGDPINFGQTRSVIFDFDSTLVSLEGLDVLASIAGSARGPEEKAELEMKVAELTRETMAGNVPFPEALIRRVGWIRPDRRDVSRALEVLKRSIEPGVKEAIHFLRDRGMKLLVVSGGVADLVRPISLELGFAGENIFSNELCYEGDVAVGVDPENFLARDQGKVHLIRGQSLPQPSVMVGDGATDLEVREHGAASYFVAYVGVCNRPEVVRGADQVVRSFSELLSFF